MSHEASKPRRITEDLVLEHRDEFTALVDACGHVQRARKDKQNHRLGREKKESAGAILRSANEEIDRLVCDILSIQPEDEHGYRSLELTSARNWLTSDQALREIADILCRNGESELDARKLAANDRW